MMTQDAQNLPANRKPAFFYHLGDVVYFAGDISMYGDNFYQTYKDYPCFIVAIPGNHDCQPDDPQDGPVDPNKYHSTVGCRISCQRIPDSSAR